MREEDLGTYQMLWDCPRCGTAELLGLDHRYCPACGAPQDPELRYFPSEEKKVAVEDHRYTGADRICPACETPNAALAEHCGSCGSPLDEAKAADRRESQSAAEGEAFAEDSAKAARDEARQERREEEARRRGEAPEPSDGGGGGKAAIFGGLGCFGLGAVGLFAALVLLCLGVFFWTSDTSVTVTGHRWARTVAVEAQELVKDSAWKGEVPSGATDVRCSREVKDHEKVKDGETCTTERVDNGDGTFTEKKKCEPKYRKEPVYGEKCTFAVRKWKVARTGEAKGGLKDPPKWPPVRLRAGEREGEREETYTVEFRDEGGETRSCATSEKQWRGMEVGSTWTGAVGMMGDLRCGSLERR